MSPAPLPPQLRIGCCGLDCAACDAYLATCRDDQALREKTAALWSALNQVPIRPEEIACEGCRGSGVQTVFCRTLCAIRSCALGNGFPTCGSCPQLDACPTVAPILSHRPEARANLLRTLP